jgi:hypothetical protein
MQFRNGSTTPIFNTGQARLDLHKALRALRQIFPTCTASYKTFIRRTSIVYTYQSLVPCYNFSNRGQILRRNPDKSLKRFLPCYSQSPLQLCLEISSSSNSRNLLQFLQCVTVNFKGERRKTWQKTTPLPYGLRNPDRNLKSANSRDYAQKPQRNFMFMNSASVLSKQAKAWNLLKTT